MFCVKPCQAAGAEGVTWNDGYGGYFLDYRTVTVFCTNVSLLVVKLFRGDVMALLVMVVAIV